MAMKHAITIFLVLLSISLVGCAQKESADVLDMQQNIQKEPTEHALPAADEKVYDFAINNMTVSSIDWEVGSRVSIYPLVRNLGNSVKGLEVNVLANDNVIKSYNLDLSQGEIKQLMYDWYPEEADSYVIKVVLDPDNEFLDIHPENNEIKHSFKISEQN